MELGRNKRSRKEIDFESRECRAMGGMGGIDLGDIYVGDDGVSKNLQACEANLPIIESQHSNITDRYQKCYRVIMMCTGN